MRGPPSTGSLEDPFALCIDSRGRLLITCLEGFTILRFDPSARTLTCGTQIQRGAKINKPIVSQVFQKITIIRFEPRARSSAAQLLGHDAIDNGYKPNRQSLCD